MPTTTSYLMQIATSSGMGLAVGIFVGFIVYLVSLYKTTYGVIARATTKEAIRQPVFLLLLAIGLVVILVNMYIPFFTLGDDVKMFKDCGLATILFAGLILSIWTASTSIADEIEGKTAMTLLSKPINRLQFIIGKYCGILNALLILYVPLIICFLVCVYFKVPYDAKEASKEVTVVHQLQAVVQIIPGLALMTFEVAILSAISVAISTRLPMVVNMVTCLAIFIVGHLTPTLVHAGSLKFELVEFMARVIATIVPALEVFSVQAAVANDQTVPTSYVAFSLIYTVCYSAIAILVAIILFEDRDLA